MIFSIYFHSSLEYSMILSKMKKEKFMIEMMQNYQKIVQLTLAYLGKK